MIIKDFKKLASSKIRSDALSIAEAGYEAISMPYLIGKTLSYTDGILKIQNQQYELGKYKNIYVAAIGKNSSLICEQLEELIGPSNIKAGVAIDLKHKKLNKIKVFGGTHPLPSEKNILATNKLVNTLKLARAKDLVIAIICGGGSSLACLPIRNNSCTDLQMVSKNMLEEGATIQELNLIRKHMSGIHGGNMAKYAYPATVLGLIISDVPGNDIDIVASGPISHDHSTLNEAKKVAKKFNLGQVKLSETPKDSRYFKKVSKILLASGSTALEGMRVKAASLGYKTRIYSAELNGLANKVGPKLANEVKSGEALLACGETTVIVNKPGKGGRNQDVALSALPYLQKDSVIISAASDGKDNIDVAGGIAEYSDHKKVVLNPTQAVKDNQSFRILKSINGIYKIAKITANVSDFIVVLRKG